MSVNRQEARAQAVGLAGARRRAGVEQRALGVSGGDGPRWVGEGVVAGQGEPAAVLVARAQTQGLAPGTGQTGDFATPIAEDVLRPVRLPLGQSAGQ